MARCVSVVADIIPPEQAEDRRGAVMSRIATAVAILLLLAGCGSEPQSALPTQAVTVVNEPSTTTTAPATTVVTEPSTTTSAPAVTEASTTTSAPVETVVTEASTTTSVPAESTSTTAGTTTTTTAPRCELGNALDAVWLVESDYGYGTAFHIGDGEWITAAHVLGDVETLLLRHGSEEIEATVVGIDHDTDVALLNTDTEAPPVLLAQDAPAVGSEVLAAGYPLYDESEPSVTRGIISRLERDPFLGELLLTDAAMNSGNSGGPLLTECGTVAGMVVVKIVDLDVEGIGYAVTAAELTSQLPRLRSGHRTEFEEYPSLSDIPTDTDLVQSWYIDYFEGLPLAVVEATLWEGPQTFPEQSPEMVVSCLMPREWWLWWPFAYVYPQPGTGLVDTDWLFDDGTYGFGSWYFDGEDLLSAAGWTEDLDAAALDPNTSAVLIETWDSYWEDEIPTGTALFSLDGYAEAMAALDRECP